MIGLLVGPRTLALAKRLVAAVATAGAGARTAPPLLLVDDHRPYPQAILEVFGRLRHRRRPSVRPDNRPSRQFRVVKFPLQNHQEVGRLCIKREEFEKLGFPRHEARQRPVGSDPGSEGLEIGRAHV